MKSNKLIYVIILMVVCIANGCKSESCKYFIKYEEGFGANQIKVLDDKNRICAAYGNNPCEPQLLRAYYKQGQLYGYSLTWLNEYIDIELMKPDDIIKLLLNSELKDSTEWYLFRRDTEGRIIEVCDTTTGKSIKAPKHAYLLTEIDEIAIHGVLDYSFAIRSTIRNLKEGTSKKEDEYLGYDPINGNDNDK